MIEWDRGRALSEELSGAMLGDERLNRRLVALSRAIAIRPGRGFPLVASSDAELEATYRFLNNRRVSADDVLRPHLEQSAARMRSARECLVLHDTTEFRFGGESLRAGLGPINSEKADGFLAHVAFAVSGTESRRPLGVAGLHTWTRSAVQIKSREKDPKKRLLAPDRESLRWAALVESVEERLGHPKHAIHVMDREADALELLSTLTAAGRRFVIRAARDRLLVDAGARKLFDEVSRVEFQVVRNVPLSRRRVIPGTGQRKHPPRRERRATLGIGACKVVLKRPRGLPKSVPASMEMNVVVVRDLDVPASEPPVSWTLFTHEPIDSQEDVLRVVDIYRARWTVEEFFKVIKTGCAFEKRQLESYDALTKALAIFLPVAWQMLLIRHWAENQPDRPASEILSALQIRLLRHFLAKRRKTLAEQPTIEEALFGIAALGGHLKRNGYPGWQTLGLGYDELRVAEEGWRALAGEM